MDDLKNIIGMIEIAETYFPFNRHDGSESFAEVTKLIWDKFNIKVDKILLDRLKNTEKLYQRVKTRVKHSKIKSSVMIGDIGSNLINPLKKPISDLWLADIAVNSELLLFNTLNGFKNLTDDIVRFEPPVSNTTIIGLSKKVIREFVRNSYQVGFIQKDRNTSVSERIISPGCYQFEFIDADTFSLSSKCVKVNFSDIPNKVTPFEMKMSEQNIGHTIGVLDRMLNKLKAYYDTPQKLNKAMDDRIQDIKVSTAGLYTDEELTYVNTYYDWLKHFKYSILLNLINVTNATMYSIIRVMEESLDD